MFKSMFKPILGNVSYMNVHANMNANTHTHTHPHKTNQDVLLFPAALTRERDENEEQSKRSCIITWKWGLGLRSCFIQDYQLSKSIYAVELKKAMSNIWDISQLTRTLQAARQTLGTDDK